jgi:hypothetical protein
LDDDETIPPHEDMQVSRPGAVREPGCSGDDANEDLSFLMDNPSTDAHTVNAQPYSQVATQSIDPNMVEAVPVDDEEEDSEKKMSQQFNCDTTIEKDCQAAIMAEEVDLDKTIQRMDSIARTTGHFDPQLVHGCCGCCNHS